MDAAILKQIEPKDQSQTNPKYLKYCAEHHAMGWNESKMKLEFLKDLQSQLKDKSTGDQRNQTSVITSTIDYSMVNQKLLNLRADADEQRAFNDLSADLLLDALPQLTEHLYFDEASLMASLDSDVTIAQADGRDFLKDYKLKRGAFGPENQAPLRTVANILGWKRVNTEFLNNRVLAIAKCKSLSAGAIKLNDIAHDTKCKYRPDIYRNLIVEKWRCDPKDTDYNIEALQIILKGILMQTRYHGDKDEYRRVDKRVTLHGKNGGGKTYSAKKLALNSVYLLEGNLDDEKTQLALCQKVVALQDDKTFADSPAEEDRIKSAISTTIYSIRKFHSQERQDWINRAFFMRTTERDYFYSSTSSQGDNRREIPIDTFVGMSGAEADKWGHEWINDLEANDKLFWDDLYYTAMKDLDAGKFDHIGESDAFNNRRRELVKKFFSTSPTARAVSDLMQIQTPVTTGKLDNKVWAKALLDNYEVNAGASENGEATIQDEAWLPFTAFNQAVKAVLQDEDYKGTTGKTSQVMKDLGYSPNGHGAKKYGVTMVYIKKTDNKK